MGGKENETIRRNGGMRDIIMITIVYSLKGREAVEKLNRDAAAEEKRRLEREEMGEEEEEEEMEVRIDVYSIIYSYFEGIFMVDNLDDDDDDDCLIVEEDEEQPGTFMVRNREVVGVF